MKATAHACAAMAEALNPETESLETGSTAAPATESTFWLIKFRIRQGRATICTEPFIPSKPTKTLNP